MVRPRREATPFPSARWFSNVALWPLAVAFQYVLGPIIAIITAHLAYGGGAPSWMQLVIGIPALDLAYYGLHRLLHANQSLWRFHALHHSDPELDITTALRHHPGEAVLIGILVGFGGAALGLSPWVIALYGLVDLCIQFLAHANVHLPRGVSDKFGRVVVTPDLHAVHHSRAAPDFGANFGAVFSIWDQLFRTYRKEPYSAPNRLELGIDGFREREFQRFDKMLMLPLLMSKARD